MPKPECGGYSDITFTDETVIKVSKATFPTEGEADAYAARLTAYGAELADGPIKTAHLLGASAITDDFGAFRVQHEVVMVPGDSVRSRPYGERRTLVAGMIADVVNAPSLPGQPLKLLTPLDARASNYHLDGAGEPVLIDLFPPFHWHNDRVRSGLPQSAAPDESPEVCMLNFGLKTGAIARLLLTVVRYHPGPRLEQLEKYVVSTDWYDDLLPDNMHPDVERGLDGQVQRRLRLEKQRLSKPSGLAAARGNAC